MSPDRPPDRSDPALERNRANAARAARAAAPVVSPRRRPQQARSQAKVDALLDAADSIVIEVGIDGLTTTVVAARAGVAVGSLYRYFDGVPELVEALATRHLAGFERDLEQALTGRTFRRKRDAANASLDALIHYTRAHPGFRALWQGAPALVNERFDAASERLLPVVLAAMVADGLAAETDPSIELEAQIQFATTSALILLAFRRDPDGDPVVLAHLRHLFTLDIVASDDVDLDHLDRHRGARRDVEPRGIGPVVTLD